MEEVELEALFKEMQRFSARFVSNNLSSGNLQRLILHGCTFLLNCGASLSQSHKDEELLVEDCQSCVTALLICRIFVQYFMENLKGQDLLALHLSGWDDTVSAALFELPEVGKGVPRALMKSLVSFMVSVRITKLSYQVYEEACNLLIVLCSPQMFNRSVEDPSLFLDMLLDEGDYFGASTFMAKLLSNLSNRLTRRPKNAEQRRKNNQRVVEEPSLLSRLAGLGSSVFSLPLNALRWFLPNANNSGVPAIANSCALILLLIGNCRRKSHFNDAFTLVHDAQSPVTESLPLHAFQADFAQLVDTFSRRLDDDPHILLFYFLLHRNIYFRQFIQSRTDLDSLLLPLLRHLYDITGQESIDSQQVYIVLIVLLLLSQDEEFGVVCEKIKIAEVEWYKEQLILDVSVSDLIAIVLIRTVMLNLSRLQDGYLHSNCLAILANLSSSFSCLHVHTSHRLFSLLFFLNKRHGQAQSKVSLRQTVDNVSADDAVLHLVVDNVKHSSNNKSNSNSNNNNAMNSEGSLEDADELASILELYEQLIGILLEVLQSVVSHSINQNASFVYALLHAREQMEVVALNERWHSMCEPLMKLIHHFEPLIEDLNGGEPKTIEEVLGAIERGIMGWPVSPHVKGVLKFSYSEEKNAEQFFTPYVMSLIFRYSGISFNPYKIVLFFVPEMERSSDNDPLAIPVSGLVLEP